MVTTTTYPRPCQGKNQRGESCGGWAVTGSDYCFWHDPSLESERKAARMKGGRARHGRAIRQAAAGEWVEIQTVGDVVALLTMAVNDVLALENSLQRARALGYLAGVILKGLEVGELEERLEVLENRILGGAS